MPKENALSKEVINYSAWVWEYSINSFPAFYTKCSHRIYPIQNLLQLCNQMVIAKCLIQFMDETVVAISLSFEPL